MNETKRPAGRRDPDARHRNLMVLLTYSPALVVAVIFFTARGNFTAGRLAAMAFVVGLVGLIIVARKESPTVLGSLRGRWAVAQGLLIAAAFWLAALYFVLLGS